MPIAENIRNQARYSKALFIWTDCDREGEHIGTEVRQQARSGNARIDVKRAKFSNTERAYVSIERTATSNTDSIYTSHVLRAAREPVELDEWQANAVAARIELDLRIGAAFTRLQTLQLQAVVAVLKEKVISYGRSFA